jgi:hypothetical protein
MAGMLQTKNFFKGILKNEPISVIQEAGCCTSPDGEAGDI